MTHPDNNNDSIDTVEQMQVGSNQIEAPQPLPSTIDNSSSAESTPDEAQKAIDEAKEKQNAIVFQTVAFDARFPNQNQTLHCWRNYVDYFRCVTQKGEEYKPCEQFRFAYKELCPTNWLERWDSLRENDLFDVDFSK